MYFVRETNFACLGNEVYCVGMDCLDIFTPQ